MPDIDIMTLFGGTHTVYTENTETKQNPFRLTLSTANCYPAYYRIKVKGQLKDITKPPIGWKQRFDILTTSELLHISNLCTLFSCGVGNCYFYHVAFMPFILHLLCKILALFISWCPVLFMCCYSLIMSQLVRLYGNFAISLMYMLSIAYSCEPAIIDAVSVSFGLYYWFGSTCRLIEIYAPCFHQGQLSVLQNINRLVDWLVRHLSDKTCVKWFDDPKLRLFGLERIMSVLLYLYFLGYALDRAHCHIQSEHFRKMTFYTSCFPGVLNKWLVYITRRKIRWLSSSKSIQKRRELLPIAIYFSGPSENRSMLLDLVPALQCTTSFPTRRKTNEMQHNVTWPAKEFQKFINKIPGVLVAVGHFHSRNNDIEWRSSWSIHELLLAETIPAWAKQGYRAFKYTVNVNLKRQRTHRDNADGRGLVGSYHMKTVFYEYLQNPKAWLSACPYKLFLSLLHKLKKHLRTRNLPHFFVPQCNLLQTTPHSELRLALRCVKRILSDPITAILQSPLHIHSVYGGWPWSGKAKQSQQLLIQLIHKMQIGKLSNKDRSLLKSTIQAIDIYRQQKWRFYFCNNAEVDPSTCHPLISLESLLFTEQSVSIESGKTTSMAMILHECFATSRSVFDARK